MNLEEIRTEVAKLQGQRDAVAKRVDELTSLHKQYHRRTKVADLARKVVREAALITQSQLEFSIAKTVTTAQQVVFEDPYEFKVQFEEKRGKTECKMYLERDGELYDPLASTGYGVVDIAAFALRVASWSMAKRSRSILLLDEPFKHLKGEAENRRAIMMMKEISKELGLQIITISDERAPREDIMAGADRVFEVTIRDGKSRVDEIV